jgi:hypothetical protein
MGLGIYISRLLARQLGVGVSVASLDDGTEVRLLIPRVWRASPTDPDDAATGLVRDR